MDKNIIKKGKQTKFVNEVVINMDESFVCGENLFGESPSNEVDKVDHLIQLGNLRLDRKKFKNPQGTRIHSPKGCAPTLCVAYPPYFLIKDNDDYRIRYLTGFEMMRLMGCEDDDIQKLVDAGLTNNQLGQLAGNSIVVDIMSDLYKEMIKH